MHRSQLESWPNEREEHPTTTTTTIIAWRMMRGYVDAHQERGYINENNEPTPPPTTRR